MISIIAAMSENRVIGKAGKIPWHLSEDLKRFKSITLGNIVIMGRKTFDSLGRNPLNGRLNIIITKNDLQFSECAEPDQNSSCYFLVESIESAISLAKTALGEEDKKEEIFVIGGGQIYEQVFPITERLYITLIHSRIEGDVFFPEIDSREWQQTKQERFNPTDKFLHPYSFLTFERIKKPKS